MNQNSSTLSDDAPLLSLILKPLHEMEEDELREHTKRLRELSSSSVTLRSKIKKEKAVPKGKTTRAPKKKIDVSKYLKL